MRARLAVVEEDHVGLDPLRVEDAGRQAQDGVQVGVVEQLAADRLAGAALEQDVVGHDHGGAAAAVEHGADVLHEVELLVGGGRPEVLPVVGQVVGFLLAVFVGEAQGALLAERRIRQHVVIPLAVVGDQGVMRQYGHAAVDLADVVQEQVHQAQPPGVGDDLVAVKRVVLEKRLLIPVEGEVGRVGDEVVGAQEEPAGAAGGVRDALPRLGAHALDHGADQGARGEVLARARLGVLGVLLQQPFVDVALDVRAEGDPVGVVHHVDEAVELRRVLNLVLRLGEDLAEHALPGAEFAQQRDVMKFERRAALAPQALPVVRGRNAYVTVVGRLAVFIGHLEEDQEGKLLQVVAVADAVIAQGSAEAPDSGDDRGSVHRRIDCEANLLRADVSWRGRRRCRRAAV